MPTIDVRPFKDNTSNADILNAIRGSASPDYMRRIPEATKANVQDVLQNLTHYRPLWNEFVDALINRIGLVIVRNNTWTNPLAIFKRGQMNYGDTIEEVNVGLIKSRVYNSDRLNLERDIFGNYPPEVQSSFHRINREEYYPITVNQELLKRAFLEEGGLTAFVTSILQAPTTSDQVDEFLITCSLITEFHKAGGFFNVNVPDISAEGSTEADAKFFARRVREMAGNLAFMSTLYNPAHMPVAVDPDELYLLITPEALAAMDVEALAAAFNIEKAALPGKITIIPRVNWGFEGVQAVLTTKDFFVIADVLIENTSQYNPVALSYNNFFHHWEILSVSRFVPAILFTSTEASTVIEIDDTPVTSVGTITVVDEEQNVMTDVVRGNLYQVLGEAITTPAGGVNDSVRLTLTGALSSHTRLKQTGVLTVAGDEPATSLTIEAYAIDTDIPQLMASVTVNVVGDKVVLWPDPHVDVDSNDNGIFEVTPDTLTMDATTFDVVVPDQEGVVYSRTVTSGVTFTDAGDVVTVPDHQARVGDAVVFGAITSTTGIVAGTTYYVNDVIDGNTFTIAATPGGATLALTTDGSAASAKIQADAGTYTVPAASTWTFSAAALSGYEIAAGATTSWPFTRS